MTKITIHGREFVISPLTIGQLRRGGLTKIKEHDELIAQDGKIYEAMGLRAELVYMAIAKNNPGLTEEEFLDIFDVGPESQLAFRIVLGASNLGGTGEVEPSADPTTSGQSTDS